MLEGIRENGAAIAAIAEATKVQSETIADISVAIGEVDEMTRSNAQLVEESTAAITRTVDQANDLDRQVDVFILDGTRQKSEEARSVGLFDVRTRAVRGPKEKLKRASRS
jgi:methyl-accepting chemotaxis protein